MESVHLPFGSKPSPSLVKICLRYGNAAEGCELRILTGGLQGGEGDIFLDNLNES